MYLTAATVFEVKRMRMEMGMREKVKVSERMHPCISHCESVWLCTAEFT